MQGRGLVAIAFFVGLLMRCVSAPYASGQDLPNVLIILADDLGYGDLSCYNDQSKVSTPHIDRLAGEGMRFLDAHSPATVCTPTRYGLMTGQMPFRIQNGGTVFTGVGGPSLIAKDRLTLPEMLKKRGYTTACVGKWLGIDRDTLVLFTSDNGPEVTSVVHMRADHHHDGARPWRGMKRDQWEGGHRVPFIARWTDQIPANAQSSQLISLTDVMATLAAIVKEDLPVNAAEDSFNVWPALRDSNHPPIRPYLITQAFGGVKTLAIRRGPWKYMDHIASGGNRYDSNPSLRPYALPEAVPEAPSQLYNLQSDPGETKNLFWDEIEIAYELKLILDRSKESGRSR